MVIVSSPSPLTSGIAVAAAGQDVPCATMAMAVLTRPIHGLAGLGRRSIDDGRSHCQARGLLGAHVTILVTRSPKMVTPGSAITRNIEEIPGFTRWRGFC